MKSSINEMETAEIEVLFGQCRCCLKKGYHMDITRSYDNGGGSKVAYRDMLLDCFNIFLSTSTSLSSLICSSCVRQLHESARFKTMVIDSEQWLLREAGKINTEFVNVLEESDVLVEDHVVKSEPNEIKMEIEEEPSNDAVAFDHDDLSKIEVTVNERHKAFQMRGRALAKVEGLVEGEAEFLARYASFARPLPTRDCLHVVYPNFAKQLELMKDKVITSKMIEELLESERDSRISRKQKTFCSEKVALVLNCALLLENSNLTPFKSKSRSGFPCFYCRHLYENVEKLKEHQTKTHNRNELRKLLRACGSESIVVYVDTSDLKCTICNQEMKTVNDLKTHLIKVHKKVFHTGVTDRVIPFKLTLTNIYECQVCGFSLETFGSIERHMNTHYRNYVCKECGSGFVTKYRLKVHIKSMHSGGAFPCEQCNKVFASNQKLRNHNDTVHRLIKRFKCPKCFERFSEYFKRQKHMVDKHGMLPLKYKCNVCDKSFDRRYTLSRHMKREHLEERDYQCETCAYKCFTNSELQVHMIKHSGERIHECSVCKKAYARKKTLREHLRIHNNDRRFSCAVCGQAFVQKCSLKGHMKTHHVEYSQATA